MKVLFQREVLLMCQMPCQCFLVALAFVLPFSVIHTDAIGGAVYVPMVGGVNAGSSIPDPNSVANGWGMSDGNAGDKTATHNNAVAGQGMWLTGVNPINNGFSDPTSTGWITFDFGRVINNLDEMLIWNYNELGYSNLSLRQVDITYSVTDDTGLGNLLYDNLLLNPGTDTPFLSATDAVPLGVPGTGISARAVRITIDGGPGIGNHRASDQPYAGHFGLSEVRFYRTPAPAPAQELSDGYRIIRDRGLQVMGSVWPSAYPDVPLDLERLNEANFTTIDFGFSSGPEALGVPPGVPWARWTFPGRGTVPYVELPWTENLVALQHGDEHDITDASYLSELQVWMSTIRPQFPDTLFLTNQYGATPTESELRDYMQLVRPDMLKFDTYPFSGDASGTSPSAPSITDLYAHMAKYRRVALEGYDGTGTKPIPYGMYTQGFVSVDHSLGTVHTPSESEIRLNHFAAWTFGFTMTDVFIYNDLYDGSTLTLDSILFDNTPGYASPTPSFYQMAEVNRQGQNLGPALVRLKSVDIRMLPGLHRVGVTNVPNTVPDGVETWSAGTVDVDPYITSISVTNIGSRNDGLRGDAWIGYFTPMLEIDDGPSFTNELYFMVLNGLSDQTGTALQTQQQIRLDFDFQNSGIDSLQRLNRDTGLVEVVSLVHDGGGLYHLLLTLDGGTGDLFKFNTGATFIVSDRVPLAGDYNGNGVVDAADYVVWRDSLGQTGENLAADGNRDGSVDHDDYQFWKSRFSETWNGQAANTSSVPEPSTAAILVLGILGGPAIVRRIREQRFSGNRKGER